MNSAEITDALEEDILTGVYKMGDRLNEEVLAKRFDVSRTPIRESFRLLASSGLIDLIPRRGAFVQEMSVVTIIEMFDVMAELEAMCARLAAVVISQEGLRRLENANESCLKRLGEKDLDGYYYENRKLHFFLYEESGNQFLCEESKKLHRRLQPFRRAQLHAGSRVDQSNQEHKELLQAISEKRADDAASIARDHVAIQGEKVRQLLAAIGVGDL